MKNKLDMFLEFVGLLGIVFGIYVWLNLSYLENLTCAKCSYEPFWGIF